MGSLERLRRVEASASWRCPISITLPSLFNVQCSMFSVRCSVLDVSPGEGEATPAVAVKEEEGLGNLRSRSRSRSRGPASYQLRIASWGCISTSRCGEPSIRIKVQRSEVPDQGRRQQTVVE